MNQLQIVLIGVKPDALDMTGLNQFKMVLISVNLEASDVLDSCVFDLKSQLARNNLRNSGLYSLEPI